MVAQMMEQIGAARLRFDRVGHSNTLTPKISPKCHRGSWSYLKRDTVVSTLSGFLHKLLVGALTRM